LFFPATEKRCNQHDSHEFLVMRHVHTPNCFCSPLL
jgi:hypothetical protein